MEWGEEFVVSISSKLAREGRIRLCIEIRLDADSEKLWAVQSGRFAARSLALSLARSLSPRSRSPSQHSPSSLTLSRHRALIRCAKRSDRFA